jgi:F0F1-type ATP synthase membrane subunit b/b'
LKPILFILSIEEKLKSAPNDGYQTGVIIGSFLPFVIFIAIAYYLYYKAKNKKNNE